MRPTTWILLGLSVGIPACAAPDERRENRTVEEAEIVRVFEHHDVLHDIRDVAVSPGTDDVWVASGFEPFVDRYSADGRLLDRFGRKGKGPGELQNPWSLVATGDPEHPIRVWDVGNRRLVTFSADGKAVSELSVAHSRMPVRADLRRLTYGDATKLRSLGDGYVLQNEPKGMSHPVDFLTAQLLRLDSGAVTTDTIVDFPSRFAASFAELGGADTFVPLPLWTTCPDGRLALLDPFAPQILWMDAAGRTMETQPVPDSVVEITDEDVRRHLRHGLELELRGREVSQEEMDRLMDRAFRNFRSDYGRTAPPAVDLACDARSDLWIQRFGTEASPLGLGREWVRLGKDGKTEAVRFPDGFRPRVFGEREVIGILVDSLDVQSIAVARLTSP